MTEKQTKFVKALAKGKTRSAAAIEAGYSEKNPRQAAHQAIQGIRDRMPEVLERAGLGADKVVTNYLRSALNAKETKFFADKGIVTDERTVISWTARLKALELWGEFSGAKQKPADNDPSTLNQINVVVRTIGNNGNSNHSAD